MGIRLRLVITLLVSILAVIYVLPSLPQIRSSDLSAFLPDKAINLGLDLKGGIHLTLGVEIDKALESALSNYGQDIKDAAQDKGIYVYRPQMLPGHRLQFTLPKADNRQAMDEILASERFAGLNVVSVSEEGGQVRYTVELSPEQTAEAEKLAMDQAVKTLRSRIDEYGVAEPEIRQQQDNRIQVQLPGLTDPGRAIKVLERTAHLEFRLVQSFDPQARPSLNTELLPMSGQRADEPDTTILVERDVAMTGENITDARVGYDEIGQPLVDLRLNGRGAAVFEKLTAENVGRAMAIVLDGKVYSAPVIQERIGGGRCSISGSFTVEEASDLAVILRAGSLPAPVTLLEERSVGPSLGPESIEQGLNACLVGGAVVIIFMILYYGFTGFIADIALTLNIVLILAGLACFGATLTLPGIAGIILTIGTAVDANVLINERIREELRRGLSIKAAIKEGYSRATLTIVDSHLTSIIAALVLYQFGTGPIRGFAVTLTLGLTASLFTAVFVSHVLIDLWIAWRNPSKLSV